MIYSQEVEMMCPVAQGANHGPAPIQEEAKCVIPEQTIVSTNASWIIPSFTFSVSLQAHPSFAILDNTLYGSDPNRLPSLLK